MIQWLPWKGIEKLERAWNYDASYIRDTIDASLRGYCLMTIDMSRVLDERV